VTLTENDQPELKLEQELEQDAICLADIERIAAEKLPPEVWDFVSGASGAELTLAANRAAFDAVRIVPRVLRDVSQCSPASTLLGHPVSMPVATAPVAYQTLFHPDGELAAARAAKEAGIPFTVGMLSGYSIEAVAEVGARTWLQLYWLRDRDRTVELIRRAEDAGYSALMLTVDVPWMGRRLRDIRNRFMLPAAVRAANFPDPEKGSEAHRPAPGNSSVAAHTALAFDPSLSWTDIDWLRAQTSLPLIIKGILDPRDAVRVAETGADAVVVSNHGGRQLDGAIPSIDALEAVCQAVSGRCEVLLDSGIRSGVDVLKALALGADGVLLGRPLMWGLAAAGEAGARRVLTLLAAETQDALGLAGCDTITAARELRTIAPAHTQRS
jgi:4-hydroxymandelate oxidase